MNNKDLKRRILEISFKYKLSHIGSCITAVDIIDEIFKLKKPDEKFVLSSGHAGLALYCVLEKYNHPEYGKSAEEIWRHHGTHPDRCEECGIDCSSGSLGQGLPIAVGMALADRSKNVYCLISDGEMAEGSIWESFFIKARADLDNLKIYVNNNGYAAYRKYSNNWHKIENLIPCQVNWVKTDFEQLPFLKGQEAHYKIMTEEDYKEGLELLA